MFHLTSIFLVIAYLWFGNPFLPNTSNTLTIEVDGIKELEGSVIIALFDSKDGFEENNPYYFINKSIQVDDDLLSIVLYDLPKGIYAFKLFQDKNENKKLDINWMGIPTEPYAFSNNAKARRFGPPNFKACQFQIQSGEVFQRIFLE